MSGSAARDQEPEFDPFAGPAFLTAAPSTEPQREIWLAAQEGADASLSFNESLTLRFRGKLDLPALRAAFADLVARHEALRTTFTQDGLTLCVSEPSTIADRVDDFSALAPSEAEARCLTLTRSEVETPFNLGKGPLFRVRYVQWGDDETRAVLTAHHIVCDGWSVAVLVKDWAALYNARRAGTAATLAPALPFSSYAQSQATADQRTDGSDEAYWLERFSGTLPVLELPYDRPRPPVRSQASQRIDVALDPALVTAVRKVAGKLRASLFNTLLAAFDTLLFRLSAQEDLVVGIPAAGQAADGLDSLVGHCVNMLPLRAQVQANLPFSELVSAVRTAVLDANDHQLTFGALLKKLPIARDPSRLPLVTVVFNVDRGLTNETIGFEGVEVELTTNPRSFENFDLFVNAVELPSGIVLECQYATALFDEQTVRRWLLAYEKLLASIVQDPSCAIGKLPLLSDGESAQLSAWNDATRAAYPHELCVHQLILAQAARTPDTIACSFEGETLRYAELARRATQLASALRAQGIGRGHRVGLCVERSPGMLVGLLGILQTGAAYVPLDPGYPLDRLAYMVEDAGLSALVSEHKTRAELPLPARTVVLLEDLLQTNTEVAQLAPSAADAQPHDPAYVIYTSGSTGKPKGVLVPHRGAVNLLYSVQKTPGMTANDVVLAITTLSFDIALSELVLPLTVGAQIVLASRDVAADGARLKRLVEEARVTFIDATPATYRLLLAAGWTGDPSLRVICTGEAMPRDLARELVERVGSLWNGYGPTETTVWSTFYEVKKPIDRILIGKPVANTQIHVLDAALQKVPVGVPGELYIAGDGVALGYLNRPELTSERFVADPFAGTPGARMYKTGDVGRMLPSGEIECLGRNDNQVKLRGYRIELGEIENVLGQHSAVASCAVIVREDRPGDRRLVGYVVAKSGAEASDSDLRTHLKRTLPDYMVPAQYARLTTMPLTPSGKIDRKALPAPEPTAPRSESEVVAPSTPTETLLAQLFQEALATARVSIHDDFFALGGHSLLASQILSRLRRDHGIDLSFRKIFEAPTVAKLAALIDSGTGTSGPAATVQPIERRPAGAPAPLSNAQRRLWLLEELDASSVPAHSLAAAWRLLGPVDLTVLQSSLDEIARRHEPMRTTVALHGGEMMQIVAPSIALPIALIDLTDRPEVEREAAMMAEIERFCEPRFDLAHGPLFRSQLYRLAADSHVYVTLRHNIIWDGWSFDIFIRELSALYDAYAHGRPSPLAELPVSYGDYAIWHREFLKGPSLARQIAWWREQLAGNPPELVLPSDRPRPEHSAHHGANTSISLTRAESDALGALGRAHGGTLYTVLFAAFNVLLHRLSGERDIVIGSPVRARNRPEVEDLIGPFINAIVLRTKIKEGMTFVDLLQHVRSVTLDSFSHEDMPLELLGERPPVVRHFFSLQDARMRPMSLGGNEVRQLHVKQPFAGNDLIIWMMETRKELLGFCNYSSELFDAATIERFLRAYKTILAAVLSDPHARLEALPLASPQELAALAEAGAPAGQLTSDLAAPIVRHAESTPDRVALREGTLTVSYGELSRRSAGVAALLAEKGAGPGKRVAIHLRSAIERAVGLLAVARTGAAAVLLDPAFPAARTARVVNALAPELLLASEGEASVAEFAATNVVSVSPATEADGFAAQVPEVDAPALVLPQVDGRGAVHAHAATYATLASGVASLVRELKIGAGATVVGLSTPGAKLAVFELLASLTAGATFHVAARGERLPEGTALLFGSASALRGASDEQLAHSAGVVVLGSASEALLARVLAAGGTVHRLDADPAHGLLPLFGRIAHAHEAGSQGRALFPTRAAVHGDDDRPCAPDVPGTLQLGSAADRTLRSTGRRARMRSDGVLVPFGAVATRELSGHLLDLGELSHALTQHPAIADAAALAVAGKADAVKIAAYVVVRAGKSYTETELRRHLRTLVPELLVPQSFVEAEALPRDARGEVDFARLPPAFPVDAGSSYVAPRSEPERLLAELWRAALGVPRVGVHDNFFALGGQSLSCFKVLAELEQKTGTRLSPRIMLLGSLEQVALELRAEGVAPEAAPPETASPASAEHPAPSEATVSARLFTKLKGLLRRD